MLRYARLLEQELRERGHAVRIVYPPSVVLKRTGTGVPFVKWLAYIDKYLLAPRFLREQVRDADIVHVCDHSNSMYLKLAGDTPSVLTCHDLLAVFAAQGRFPGITISGTGRLLQRSIAAGILRARFIVSVSQKTDEDIRELSAGHPPPSSVVHNPLNWNFHPVQPEETAAVLTKRGLQGREEYLVHIGNNSWYKNRPAVVRIFAELKKLPRFQGTKLLLAGKPWDAALRSLVESTGVAADIHELIDVSNEELRALYSGAAALLFPSRHEGFGWPILEAQACGCAVITTNRPPMTEVAGNAAILIDPDEPAAAAATIHAAWGSLPALRAAGLENVKRFSIDHAVNGYLAAYETAIRQQSK